MSLSSSIVFLTESYQISGHVVEVGGDDGRMSGEKDVDVNIYKDSIGDNGEDFPKETGMV